MNIEELARQIGKQAQEQQALKAERESEQTLDFAIKIITAQYTNAKAYSNLLIVAGYATFFAMWGFVREDIPEADGLWALLLMTFSGAAFVLFEVYKMIRVAFWVNRKYAATEDVTDPLARLHEVEKAEEHGNRVFGKVWIFALVLTVPTGVAALGVLVVNMLLLLLDGGVA